MENKDLIESFLDFKDNRNIDKVTLSAILKEVFEIVIRREFGTSDNFDIIVNGDKGDLEVWRNREVVADEDVEDDIVQIALSDAKKIEEDFEIGEEVAEEIKLKDLGRRNILTLKQTLLAKLNEYDNTQVYKKYKDLIGEIVTGEVYHIRPKAIILIQEDATELILAKNDQIPRDFFKKGENVTAIIKNVEMRGNRFVINVSRTDPRFLSKLFEQEIPEVFDGLINVRKVARIPGEKAKVAVDSYDDRIDPVGACVGMRGSRIHGIVRELANENIDVIQFTDNEQLFVTRALSPGKINSLTIDKDANKVEVFLDPEEVSKAIGRGGQNIRLASQLTGYEIEIFREVKEEEEDVELREFSDEIEEWILDELYKIGCNTAKNVLNFSVEQLEEKTTLEKETIEEIFTILSSEFDKE